MTWRIVPAARSPKDAARLVEQWRHVEGEEMPYAGAGICVHCFEASASTPADARAAFCWACEWDTLVALPVLLAECGGGEE